MSNKSDKALDSKPKPKLPLPKLRPCPNPDCDGEGKVEQNNQGEECYASVYCKKCKYGTITRRPKDGESNRENKIAAINEWNEGLVFPPDEREKLNKRASRMHKKAKDAEKKARREAKRRAKKNRTT